MSHTVLDRWLLVSLVASAAIGCSTDDAFDPGVPRAVDVTRAEIQAAVHSNGVLARKLAGVLRDRPGNLIYSPLSVEAVLGMLYAGAAGETAAQLREVLGTGDDTTAFHTGLGSLLEDLRGDHGYTLDIANRLFVQEGATPLPSFAALMSDAYRAPAQSVDYADPNHARGIINRWVADETHGHIPELLRSGDVTNQSVLTVADAIYFKADWAEAFDQARTSNGPFHRADGSDVSAPMMQETFHGARTGELDGAMILELPYRSGELSCLVWLPPDRDGLPQLEQAMSNTTLAEALASMRSQSHLQVSLPRFTLRARLDLPSVLKQLNVDHLFDGRADLSGIFGASDLSVSTMVQEAWVSVDEQGTEAAAATAAVVGRFAPTRVIVDHPFLFMIYDQRTGSVLFTGRVVDPS